MKNSSHGGFDPITSVGVGQARSFGKQLARRTQGIKSLLLTRQVVFGYFSGNIEGVIPLALTGQTVARRRTGVCFSTTKHKGAEDD